MIRVTVDIVPFGDEERKREAYQLIIYNDKTGDFLHGNYVYKASKLGLHKLVWKEGKIKGFPRKCKDVLSLLKKVLDDILEEKDEG